MRDRGGLVFVVREPSRADKIAQRVEASGTFTDVLSTPDLHLKPTEMAIISLDHEHLHYAAIARRGDAVATAKRRVRFTDIVDLHRLGIGSVEDDVEARFVRHLMPAFSGGGARPPLNTWRQLIDSVKRLRPAVSARLEHLERISRAAGRALSGRGFDVLALEKDAVGLALDMFGFNRSLVLGSWTPADDGEPAPFLRGLAPSYLIEDQMIARDASFFGDWSRLPQQHLTGAAEFGRDGERLTVWNVNRTALEHALGVDLLYYHHRYQSYMLVQYKAMERPNSGSEAVFRPDEGTAEQVQRMCEFCAENPDSGPDNEANLYRLHPGAFLFKLCPRIVFEPDSTGLIKGMYLPLDYYQLLITSGQVAGPRGGTALTYESVGRYLNNTMFVELVQRGWIGSRASVSDAVSLAAQQARTGRDLIVAATSSGCARSPAGSDQRIAQDTERVDSDDDGSDDVDGLEMDDRDRHEGSGR